MLLASDNEVKYHRARLVFGWLTGSNLLASMRARLGLLIYTILLDFNNKHRNIYIALIVSWTATVVAVVKKLFSALVIYQPSE